LFQNGGDLLLRNGVRLPCEEGYDVGRLVSHLGMNKVIVIVVMVEAEELLDVRMIYFSKFYDIVEHAQALLLMEFFFLDYF